MVALEFVEKGKKGVIGYVDEPPEYAVVFVDADRIVIHSHSYPGVPG